jgi:outer membrane protein assembly factor BamB
MKNKTFAVILTILILGLLLSACSASGTAVNTWGGAAIGDSMVYYAAGPQVLGLRDSGTNYTLTWSYPEKASAVRLFMAAPLITGDQLILADYSGIISSVSLDGGIQNWQYPMPDSKGKYPDAKGRYIDTPLFAGDLIVAPNADGHIYALDLTGALKWTYPNDNEKVSKTDGAFWAQPASDGKTIFAPSLDHKLYFIDLATGTPKINPVDLKSPLVARPLYAEGVVYLGNMTGDFFAVSASDGTIKWDKKVSGGVWSQPILADGKLFFGDESGLINILSASDGTVINSVDTGSSVLGSGAVLPDGIAFGTEAGKIVLVDMEGKSKPLMTLTNGSIYSNLVVNGERLVVLAYKGDKPLVALDLKGNEAWFYSTKK